MSFLSRMAASRIGGPFVANNFATRTYTGDGAVRNINSGISMSEYGGMIITRRRDSPLVGVCSDTTTGINNGYYVGSGQRLHDWECRPVQHLWRHLCLLELQACAALL